LLQLPVITNADIFEVIIREYTKEARGKGKDCFYKKLRQAIMQGNFSAFKTTFTFFYKHIKNLKEELKYMHHRKPVYRGDAWKNVEPLLGNVLKKGRVVSFYSFTSSTEDKALSCLFSNERNKELNLQEGPCTVIKMFLTSQNNPVQHIKLLG